MFELETLACINILKKRKNNPELQQYYLLAVNLVNSTKPFRKTDSTHRVGKFLLEYFRDESKAIEYLEDVSLKTLSRLSNEAQAEIIRNKPLRTTQLPQLILGQNDNGADDLWSPSGNSWDNLVFSELDEPIPEPPKKKRRRNIDDSEEDRVTSLTDWRRGVTETTRNPLGISTTQVLDEFPWYNLRRVEEYPDGQVIIENHF